MKIFAHRGASALEPENTEAAIKLAAQHSNVHGIEIDVFQHGEEFIVLHDVWLDRTTNGTGHIHDVSLSALRRLDAGKGFPIPLLREVFAWSGNGCELNIEIKSCDDIAALLNYVHQHNHTVAPENIIYSAFNHHWLAEAKRLSPELRIAALTASIPLGFAQFGQDLLAESVNVEAGVINPAMIRDAHERGLEIMVYTVDRPAELRKLRDWGVDGVFANDPEAADTALRQC